MTELNAPENQVYDGNTARPPIAAVVHCYSTYVGWAAPIKRGLCAVPTHEGGSWAQLACRAPRGLWPQRQLATLRGGRTLFIMRTKGLVVWLVSRHGLKPSPAFVWLLYGQRVLSEPRRASAVEMPGHH